MKKFFVCILFLLLAMSVSACDFSTGATSAPFSEKPVADNQQQQTQTQVVAPAEFHTVTLSANDPVAGKVFGGGAIEKGQACTIAATTNEGYTFLGWYSSGTLLSDSETLTLQTVDEDIAITAFWAPDSGAMYTVNYYFENIIYNDESDRWTENTAKRQLLVGTEGELTDVVADEAEGFTPKETEQKEIEREGTAVSVFYLRNSYTVTFKAEGETFAEREYRYGAAVVPPAEVPTKEHYVFSSWVLPEFMGAEDITSDALWSPKSYTITYDAAGGVYSTPPRRTYTVESGEYTLPAPTRRGYSFTGYEDGATTIPAGSSGNRTYVATWEIIVYEISYIMSGATTENPSSYTVESADIELLAAEPNDGFRFCGWYRDAQYKNELSVIESGSVGDLWIYGKVIEPQTLTFNIDGKAFDADITAFEGESVELPVLDCASLGYVGYTADEWYYDAARTSVCSLDVMPVEGCDLFGELEYTVVGEGFYPYTEEFSQPATELSPLVVDSFTELVAFIDYILFYEYTDYKYVDLNYTITSVDEETEFDKAFEARTMASPSLVRAEEKSTLLRVRFGGSFRDRESTLTSSDEDNCPEISSFLTEKPSDLREKTDYLYSSLHHALDVSTSNQLQYVLEHGMKPIVAANSPAEKILKKAKTVGNGIFGDDYTVFQKLKALFDWCVSDITYDYTAVNDHNEEWYLYDAWYAEGVFNNGTAVCDGISKAVSILACLENIPTVRVTSGNHAWNRVLWDGSWYSFDGTWGNKVTNGEEGIDYKWFLTTDAAKTAYSAEQVGRNYSNIVANTAFDPYEEISYETFDLSIDSKAEMESMFAYCAAKKEQIPANRATLAFRKNYTWLFNINLSTFCSDYGFTQSSSSVTNDVYVLTLIWS